MTAIRNAYGLTVPLPEGLGAMARWGIRNRAVYGAA